MCQPKRWWSGLIPVCLIWLAAIAWFTKPVQWELAAKAGERDSWQTVDIQGRDAIIYGTAPSQNALDLVIKKAQATSGIRQISNAATLLAEAKPYALSAEFTGQDVLLKGVLGSQTHKDELLAQTKAVFKSANIKEEITLARGMPDDFLKTFNFGLAELSKMKSGKIELKDRDLSVLGLSFTENIKKSSKEALKSLPQGFTLAQFDVAAPQPLATTRKPPDQPPNVAETTAAIPTCPTVINTAIGTIAINFETSSAKLTTSERGELKALVSAMQECPTARLIVRGHADGRRSQDYNIELGKRRAMAVIGSLERSGIKGDRLVLESAGSKMPLDAGASEEALARNRRVEFLLKP